MLAVTATVCLKLICATPVAAIFCATTLGGARLAWALNQIASTSPPSFFAGVFLSDDCLAEF